MIPSGMARCSFVLADLSKSHDETQAPTWLRPLRLSDLHRVVRAAAVLAHAADINRVIRSHAAQFSGTILVAKEGKPVFHESFGLASRQFDVPNANSTKYKIASITKLFTSVMALQLYQEGKLTLHTPFATYLPSCAGELGSNVTVHQLLNHTSGMKDVVAVKSKEDGVRNGIDLYQRVWVREDSLAGRKVKTVTRPGQIMGANTVLYRVVQAGLTVIVLSNTDISNVDALACEVSKAALE